jgi:hypothetical protein
MRKTAISPSGSLGSRLDSLLNSRFALQARQRRITGAADLPVPLSRTIRQLMPQCEWRAFGAADSELFVAIARPRPRDRGAMASSGLEVYQMDAGASVYAAAVWEHDPKRGWWLDSVLDLSYDCDHGWWLADLIDIRATLPSGATRHCGALLERAQPAPA